MNRPALCLASCLGLVTPRARMSGPVPPAAAARRLGRRIAAAVLLALAQAPAQAADLLVGNQGQPTAEREGVDWGKREYGWAQLSGMFNRAHIPQLSQGFTTGPNPGGYLLESVRLNMQIPGHGDGPWYGKAALTVAIHEDAGGFPGAHVATLAPQIGVRGANEFRRQTGAHPHLRPNTAYHVKFSRGNGRVLLDMALAGGQTGVSGWSMADTHLYDVQQSIYNYGHLGTNDLHYESILGQYGHESSTSPGFDVTYGWHTASQPLKLDIRGTAVTGSAPQLAASHSREFAENAEAGAAVGAPIAATDEDGDTILYELTGADADAFEIDAASGQISTKEGVRFDYELRTGYRVTVVASDGNGNAVSAQVNIRLTDVDETLTASFEGAPATHDGAPFKVKLRFSEPAAVAWEQMRDRLLEVTNGRVAYARRPGGAMVQDLSGQDLTQLWEIMIEPTAPGSVTVTLPATADCAAADAVCTTDGRPLSAEAAVTVAEGTVPDLTASFAEAPEQHDGTERFTVKLQFNRAVDVSYEAMKRKVLDVANGRVTGAVREMDRRDRWIVTIEPDSVRDVTVTLGATTDCADAGAVCALDGRMLTGDAEVGVKGPLSVPLTVETTPFLPVHQGVKAVEVQVRFSAPVTFIPTEMVEHGFRTSNAEITAVYRGRRTALTETYWTIRFLPLSHKGVRIVLPKTEDCAAKGAVCTADGRKLSNSVQFEFMYDGPEDTTAPAVRLASVDGTKLTLTITEGLDEDSTPAASAFAVTVAGAARSLAASDPVSIAGRRVTLTLASAVSPGEAVSLSYTKPAENPLKDRADIAAASFSGRQVTNRTVAADTVAPTLESAAANGDYVQLTYSESLDSGSVPASSAFTVTVDGTVRALAPDNPVAVLGRTVTLMPASALAQGESVTVSYAPPTAGALQDGAGNRAASVTDREVSNRTGLGTSGQDTANNKVKVEFRDLPKSHRGREFEFELRFGEEVEVDYLMLRGASFSIMNGRVTRAQRIQANSSRRWKMKVTPQGLGNVVVTMPAMEDCDAEGAICTEDDRALADTVVAVVPETVPAAEENEEENEEDTGEPDPSPLRVAFEDVPRTHPGSGAIAFRIVFSEEPHGLGYLTLRNHTLIAKLGGRPIRPTRSAKVDPPSTLRWDIVIPHMPIYSRVANENFTLEIAPTQDCEAEGAVCTLDGRKLSNRAYAVVKGPAHTTVTASFSSMPERHRGDAFSFRLSFNAEFPVSAETVRKAFTVSGGTVTAATQVEDGNDRQWDVTVQPVARQAATIALVPKESCEAEGALCNAAGNILSEAVEAEVAWRIPAQVESATVDSDPGGNGVWDAGETVLATVRFSEPVRVMRSANARPTLGILLDGARREAQFVRGHGTRNLQFEYAVAAADNGARRARIESNGIALNGTSIKDAEGYAAELGFTAAPALWVADVTAMEGTDATADFIVTLDPAATEAVTVDYATADDTATAGDDYTAVSGTLTFSAGETSKTVSVPIVDDGLEDGGETFTLTLSNPSGADAQLADAQATATIINDEVETPALTAAFTEVPASHGGETFTFRLDFSEEVPGLGWQALRGDILQASGGTVRNASRVDRGSNLSWTVTVEPDGTEDVTVTLPATTTDCEESSAICTEDDRPLSAAASVTVPHTAASDTPVQDTPFTVRLDAVPAEHDGESAVVFEVQFSDEPHQYSYRTLRDETLEILQGDERLAPRVQRIDKPSNRSWTVTVEPSSKADLTIAIAPTADCATTGAVCNEGGTPLSNAVSATVPGPPGLSVADAQVEEAAGATVDFAVTMSRASASTVTVDYATADGSATAGSDYTATSGTLTFAPGETAKTVSVPVLDDAHDEGEETFTLTLSNPSGGNAWLEDATATGTIENSDAMPQAWLARFGRTVAEQVVEAVEGRFAARRAPGIEMTLAGERVGAAPGEPGWKSGAGAEARARRLEEHGARARLAAMTDRLNGAGTRDGEARRAGYRSRGVTPRELLTGSSFALTGEAAAGGTVSLWGRGAVSHFDGIEGDLALDGEVVSAMLGADWSGGPGSGSGAGGAGAWTAGLLVSHSAGEGGYRGPEAGGAVESTLTAVFPYGRYALNDRVSVWGIAGYGAGELTLTPKNPGTGASDAAMRTDMDLTMAAAGLRGVAVQAGPEGGFELAVKTDAMAVRTTSEKAESLEAAGADVTRLRLGLEGSWRGLTLGEGALVPNIEVGVRHDGGDAETGFGLDLGGGLAWSDPANGLSAEVRARGLLTHESKGFRDRGLLGAFSWAPGRGSGRGPSLTLTQSIGDATSGGMETLLGQRHLGDLAANDPWSGSGADGDDLKNRRLELRMGYGFSVLGDRFTLTPEAGLGLANGHRDYTLGWRLGMVGGGTNAFEVRFEARRSESTSANDNLEPQHGVGFRATARW